MDDSCWSRSEMSWCLQHPFGQRKEEMEQMDRILVIGQCWWWYHRFKFYSSFNFSDLLKNFKIKDKPLKISKPASKLKHVLFLKADFSLKWIWHRSKLIIKAWTFWRVPLIEIQSWDTNYSEWSGYLMRNLLFSQSLTHIILSVFLFWLKTPRFYLIV